MELQTLHVRTQTLGSGMKVVLGWVEGMAEKVSGLHGAQALPYEEGLPSPHMRRASFRIQRHLCSCGHLPPATPSSARRDRRGSEPRADPLQPRAT